MTLFKGLYYSLLGYIFYSCNVKTTPNSNIEYLNSKINLDTFQNIEKSEFQNQINAQIQQLEEYDFFHSNFDLDSLMNILDSNLSIYLKKARFDIDSTSKLNSIYSEDSIICVYSYSYNSGGTRGLICRSIIQWKKSDGTYGLEFLMGEAEFFNSHKLISTSNNNLYLFLGSHKGDGINVIAYAQIIQIANDSLKTDYPGFFNKFPYIVYSDNTYSPEDNYCIACIDYDSTSQLLFIDKLGNEDQIYDPEFNELKYNKKLKYLKLKFNGRYFQ